STRSKVVKSSSEYLKSISQALLTNKFDIPKQIVATQSRKRKEVAPIKIATTRKIRRLKNLIRKFTPSMISIMYAHIPNHSSYHHQENLMNGKDLVHELRPTIVVDDSSMTTFTLPLQGDSGISSLNESPPTGILHAVDLTGVEDGVVLAWHNNWVLVARFDDHVVIKRISCRLCKRVLEAAFKYLSLYELPEAHEVTLYEYEDYRIELAKCIHCIQEKYSIVHNPKRSAFKEHEPISDKIQLGPGLTQNEESIISLKAGILECSTKSGNKLWVDNNQKRYVPAAGESVLGIVTHKTSEFYRLDIGSAHQAILSNLAFENIGSLIYARVLLANKDMEPELGCVNPENGKADGFGELKNGYLLKCSLRHCRRLLFKQSPILSLLEKKVPSPFEIAIGMNGRVWINGKDGDDSIRNTIFIYNAIKKSENLDKNECIKLIQSLNI
ncbi:15381_t:CDS:2, partial [Entrophospora sp. SA101]